MYNMHGQKLSWQFSMGAEVARDGVLRAEMWDDGLVLLTTSLRLWAVSGFAEARPVRLAEADLQEAPADMVVIPPSQTLSGSVEVTTPPYPKSG